MHRKRMIDTFKDAEALGPFDEYPRAGRRKSIRNSTSVRNDRPQPFYLICGQGQLYWFQMSGTATFIAQTPRCPQLPTHPRRFCVYVPAGTPHCLIPNGVSINHRYKGRTRAGTRGRRLVLSQVWGRNYIGTYGIRRQSFHRKPTRATTAAV